VRGRANREALWGGLTSGAIDFVASDHSPCPPALKTHVSGDFFQAWGGIASLELELSVTWTGARAHGRTALDLARWHAEAPARMAGLTRKGRIAPGCDADLVVFDPDESFTVDNARLYQRHHYSAYSSMKLFGRVRQTFVRGVSVFDNGTFPSPPQGQWLTRD
jgi:allantoinase